MVRLFLDGGAFLACDAPGPNERSFAFNRSTLPGHLQGIYFLVLQLTLHQRFALMMLSEQVAQYWREHGHATGSRAREEAYTDFERLRDAFLTFTARGYFAQVMQHEHHHRCYRRWQEAFQIERLYQEVSDEIREMHGHLLLERERDAQQQVRRLEQRLNAFALLLGVPALLLTLVTAVGTVSPVIGVALAIGGAIAGWIILVALNGSLARRGRHLRRRGRPTRRKR